jgi:hypothetical protein
VQGVEMTDLEINVREEIHTKESVGGQISRLEIFLDALINFLQELKKELSKRNAS